MVSGRTVQEIFCTAQNMALKDVRRGGGLAVVRMFVLYYVVPVFWIERAVVPYGLVVRISDSHSGGRGSIPRGGRRKFLFFSSFPYKYANAQAVLYDL